MSNTNDTQYDVVGIGNAIVDILSFCDDAFLASEQLAKGSMQLVDEDRASSLYENVGQSTECSGGSVANSLAGLASLGANTAFIGKVSDDQLGSIFAHDIRSVGVNFTTPTSDTGMSTANCIVLVTPDAQRTMATYLGACSEVSAGDIDKDIISASAITYIEGYLWDTENAKEAIRKAIDTAKNAGRKVAFTLSDTFCVDRHRDEFLELIKNDIDILFANESEVKSLMQLPSTELAIASLRGLCSIVAVTLGANGSTVLTKDSVVNVPTQAIAKVVDTTGAGDLYASGFLYGLSKGWDMNACAQLGNKCAGEIIQQLGARSTRPLMALVA
jgi:sugar/nucleoside kinase (ribokinase family)